MTAYDALCSFENLYKAHLAARRGKQGRRAIIDFELDLGCNLMRLSDELKEGTYRLEPYAKFTVCDTKRRAIHALGYRDRVVQHALCDNIIGPMLEPRLIFDNAACRVGRGTHFALDRLELFLHEYYERYGAKGWFLKCDVHHFFSSVDHEILKEKLAKVPFDERTSRLLCYLIDSYEEEPGKGLPLGNQSSQWFALYYLDSLDRLVKEQFRVRGYTRYMDDMVLVHHDRALLRSCLKAMTEEAEAIGLTFNKKTQIAPLSQGIDYLGWHLYLTETGRVVRRLRQDTKRRMLRHLNDLGDVDDEQAEQIRQSYLACLEHGDAEGLKRIVKKS